MQFGLGTLTRGALGNRNGYLAVAQAAERLGYGFISVNDHIVVPRDIASRYPYSESGEWAARTAGDCLDQLATLAFLAARTERLRLLTSVMVVPQRHPVLTAKMLATIDVLSRGRVTVGVGVGWLREEFEALEAPDFTRRGAVSNEYIQILKTLWTQEPATFTGKFYQFQALHCLPHPVQKPHPPLWIGGHTPAALRRAARYGDGWHPVGANPAVPLRPHELEVALGDLKRLTEAAGRDPEALTISYKAPLYDVSLTAERQAGLERRPFSGTTEQIVADIATYSRLGVSELIFDFRSESQSESLERMEHFATVIKPAAEP